MKKTACFLLRNFCKGASKVLLLCWLWVSGFGQQGINSRWLLGYESNSGLPFGNTTLLFTGANVNANYDSLEMEFRHTHANISDSQGNLLFYTNGFYIADASNDTMLNGSGINPSPFTSQFNDGLSIPQACVILPMIGNTNVFYLIHSTANNYPATTHSEKLFFTKIDMTLNGGKGAVTVKNQVLLSDTMNVGKVVACKHANGRDWWVICHKINSNIF